MPDSVYKMRIIINRKTHVVFGNSPEKAEMKAKRLISEKTTQTEQKED